MHLRHLLVAVLALAAIAVTSTPAVANPFAKGPDPTASFVRAGQGPYGVTAVRVTDAASNSFGTGMIWRPVTTTGEKFGIIAMAPGFLEDTTATSWLGQKLASNGFVVMAFNTNTPFDQPPARGKALLAALDHMKVAASTVNIVDPTRQAVIGHSMGGGGTLTAAKARPSLKAAIGLASWHTDGTWPEITTPNLQIGVADDVIAPTFMHVIPFYNSIPATTPKAYLEYGSGSHFATNSYTPRNMAAVLSWVKRFVDNDTRYSQFICPGPSALTSGEFSVYRSSCPF
ncbi:MAG: alpha/beta hydrolase [Baekduiaceae bacterium]